MTGLNIRSRTLSGTVMLAALVLGCSGKSDGGDCTDEDGDGYGVGAGCLGEDCNDSDADCHTGTCCPDACLDMDFDGYGMGPACLGPDCNDSDAGCWEGACCPAGCEDLDGDGYGNGTDCLGPDCDDGNAGCHEGACCAPGCADGDGDGYGTGLDCLGPDCDDEDEDVNPGAEEVCEDGVDNDCLDGDALCDPYEDPEGVPIYPEDDPQSIIDANPAGTTYVMKAGTHVLRNIKPQDGDTIIFQTGASMRGSEVLEGPWTRDGELARWYMEGVPYTANDFVAGDVDSGPAPWVRPDPLTRGVWRSHELFDDGARIPHSGQPDEGGPTGLETIIGQRAWFYDDATERVYIGFDPAGAGELRFSRVMWAINGTADNVTVQNAHIFEYAAPAQHGAVNPGNGYFNADFTAENWLIEDAHIHHIHGSSVVITQGWRVLRGDFHDNAQYGMAGRRFGEDVPSTGSEVAYCEIHHNNEAGFNWGWAAGGTKFEGTTQGSFHHNWSHHNKGTGVWFDIRNDTMEIHHNLFEENYLRGLFWEISYTANIYQNLSRNNGLGEDGNVWFWNTQILVVNGDAVEVHHNVCEIPTVPDDGTHGEGPDGLSVVRDGRTTYPMNDISVHHNRIVWTQARGDFVRPRAGFGATGDSILADVETFRSTSTWTDNELFYPGGAGDVIFVAPSHPDTQGYVAVNFADWQSVWGLGLTDTFHTDAASPPRVVYESRIPDWDDVTALPTE